MCARPQKRAHVRTLQSLLFPYLLLCLGLPDPGDEVVQVVDDLDHPSLVVTLLEGLGADLGDDADAAADYGGL